MCVTKSPKAHSFNCERSQTGYKGGSGGEGGDDDNGSELSVITYELRQLSASDKAPYENRQIADGFI